MEAWLPACPWAKVAACPWARVRRTSQASSPSRASLDWSLPSRTLAQQPTPQRWVQEAHVHKISVVNQEHAGNHLVQCSQCHQYAACYHCAYCTLQQMWQLATISLYSKHLCITARGSKLQLIVTVVDFAAGAPAQAVCHSVQGQQESVLQE